jgi:hypothetical protein
MRSSRTLLTLWLGLVLAFAVFSPTVQADSITYTYTGNDFTSAEAPYSTSDFLSISITFANPLPANLGVPSGGGQQFPVDEAANILTWTVTDQINTLTPSNSTFAQPDFGTDAEGNIDLWNLTINETTSLIFLNIVSDETYPGTAGLDGSDLYSYTTGLSATGYGGPNYGGPVGTWQTTTPEPSTVVLLSLGGAILLIRKRLL